MSDRDVVQVERVHTRTLKSTKISLTPKKARLMSLASLETTFLARVGGVATRSAQIVKMTQNVHKPS